MSARQPGWSDGVGLVQIGLTPLELEMLARSLIEASREPCDDDDLINARAAVIDAAEAARAARGEALDRSLAELQSLVDSDTPGSVDMAGVTVWYAAHRVAEPG